MSRLSTIRARAQAATPGPWEAYTLTREELAEAKDEGEFDWWRDVTDGDLISSWERFGAPGGVSRVTVDEDGTRWYSGLPGYMETSAANAEFIAHARTDIEVLCDIAEAAEAVYAATDLEMREAMDGLGAALSRLGSPEGASE